MLTTRCPWGVTTVLLCTLLLQNCQSNSLRATEEEGLASGSSSALGMRHLASIVPQATLYLPLPPPSSAPAVHVPPSRSPIAPAHKKALTTTPSSRSLTPPVPPIPATVGTPSKVPSTLQPAAIPRFSHAVQLRNTPSHSPSPVLTTSSGERVKFSQVDGQWCAAIQAGSSVSTFQRTMPVVGPGYIEALLTDLQRQDVWTSRARIHVLDTSQSSYSPCVYLGKAGLWGGMPSDEEEDSKPPARRQSPSSDDELAQCHKKSRHGERQEHEHVCRDTLNILLAIAGSEPDKASAFLEVLLVAVKDKHCRQQALKALGKVSQAAPACVSACLPSLRAATRSGDRDVRLSALKALGEAEWKHYFGDVGSASPLPSDMATILDGPCPFWPGKQVKDTHLLVLVPATVAEKPFTLDLLRELIKSPKGGGHKTKYRSYAAAIERELGAQSPRSSYWMLMTRDVLPDSRDKTYDAQKELVAGYASRESVPYELPSVLEAATAILLHHAREGERLFGDDPWTYTRCQEVVVDGHNPEEVAHGYPTVVGGFSYKGLYVNYDYSDFDSRGVSGLRKF